MKRDQNYMLELLRMIENDQSFFQPIALNEAEEFLGFTPDKALTREEAVRLEFHLDQLEQEGLISIHKTAACAWYTELTAAGHRFLAKVDPAQIR